MTRAAMVRQLPARIAIFLIDLYRTYVSPLRQPTCRFMPTCSQYAVEALAEYGLLKGGWLTVVRLAKCGPWHPGGWDPIPERHKGLHDNSAGHAPVASDKPAEGGDGWDAPASRGGSTPGV